MGYRFDGELLKRERLKAGFKTYQQFRDALKKYEPKISRAVCWQWEHGKVQPSTKYLYAIGAVLNKEPSHFLKNAVKKRSD